MVAPAFIKEVWDLMGPKLRAWSLRVVTFAAVIILVMFAYLAWSTGEVYRRFGVLPTKEDMQEQTAEITGSMATKDDLSEVAAALYNYQDSLGRLRTHLDTTLIAPGLMAIVDLQRRMGRLESGQVETRLAIEEQRRQGQQGTEALLSTMNSMSSAEERAKKETERKEREQRERDRALMEAIAKKLKINTQEF